MDPKQTKSDPHALPPAAALTAAGVSTAGLSSSQAAARLAEFGRNDLPEEPPRSLLSLVLAQFSDRLVLILLAAAVVSFVLATLESSSLTIATYVEPIVILTILIANAVVGVVQETNAEKAIQALREYSPDEAKVIRDGSPTKIDARDLVPGDILLLAVGDKVPADARLISMASASFTVDQSILTGETVSVPKDPDAVIIDPHAVKQDLINMVFSGTTVTSGKSTALVVYTGQNTAIGHIHSSIASEIDEPTPLKQALDDFGDQLAKIISIICILVWAINIRHFGDETFDGNWLKGAVYYFKIAVALAVAAIPEGLAVIITTCLALGTKKMANEGAIVRRLRSVETLGCTSVICSDKTGTLTTNQMSVRKALVFSPNSQIELNITGNTYGPEGLVLDNNGNQVSRNILVSNPVLDELAQISSLCNDAKIVYDESSDLFQKIGEPTEAALKAFVEKLGSSDANFNAQIPVIPDSAALSGLSKKEKLWRVSQVDEKIASMYTRVATLEFSRDRKSMSVLVERTGPSNVTTNTMFGKKPNAQGNGSRVLYVKGAPEQMLERCTQIRVASGSGTMTATTMALTAALKTSILNKVAEWGERESLRVLALATVDKPLPLPNGRNVMDSSKYASYETNMTFVGLVGMLDPPRPEVREAIATCAQAGIRVIVITGDNKKTAEAICRQIGIFGAGEDLTGKSFTGREFDAMSAQEKREAALSADLFSRTEPTHKSALVDILKREGLVVAMTGDGVNDAPALKKADIGVAMGTGTDVAKLAADMVLADDNFSTIVSAVREGRSIYANTKQFIRYLISSNIGEVVSIFLTVVLGMPEALIPVQLLWVNLVTDGLPATALGFNPPDDDIMHSPPRNAREPIVTSWLLVRYVVVGTYVGAATVFGYAWWFMFYAGGPRISFGDLTQHHKCALVPEIASRIDCDMFHNDMSRRATTMSLSILVVVEMFNAMNSVSENMSLMTFPVTRNWYLVGSIVLSMALHCLIVYTPGVRDMFGVEGLSVDEWIAVVAMSTPVLVLDELLKWISRKFTQNPAVTFKKKQE